MNVDMLKLQLTSLKKILLHEIDFFFKTVPLRTVLILPFLLQLLGTVTLVSYLSYRNGQKAVNELASQLRNEISARIEGELTSYLESPHGFNRLNGATLAEGQFDMEEGGNAAQFLRQLRVSDFAFASYCGDAQGQWLGAMRHATDRQSAPALVASNKCKIINLPLCG